MRYEHLTTYLISHSLWYNEINARVVDYVTIVDARVRVNSEYACVAELVDALASGASVLRDVEVQVLSRVP